MSAGTWGYYMKGADIGEHHSNCEEEKEEAMRTCQAMSE